jgi:exopolyphosphatase / guanosine-5'-triphosphate,3'-diphosphate pyrophosphatase
VTRVAAVDQGTNTTRLLVADVADGRVEEVYRETRITRLGEGVDARRRLLPLPIARVRNALSDYRRIADSLGAERTLLIATSAFRDAENGEAFLGEIEWSYGFATQLLSGSAEAAMAFRGVAIGREVDEEVLVVDVGGGSTELVLGNADGVRVDHSVDIGSGRMTERFLHSDPPTPAELDACANAVGDALPDLQAERAVGVAGTVTTIGALDLRLPEYDRNRVHGHVLSRNAVEEQVGRLAAMSVAERARLPAMIPDRAPMIVGGGVILREVLRRYDLGEIEVSARDILDGAALTAAELPDTVEGDAPPGAYTCC